MQQSPDIVVIVSHDSGCHFGCYGAPTVVTPAIDGLAASGVKLANCFASAPICSPSRGSLYTGMWPQRNGLMGLAGGQPKGPFGWELNRSQDHLSHRLKAHGYETALFGHQHETEDVNTLGFDHVASYMEPGSRVPMPATEIGKACGDFLRQRGRREQPLYLQVGFFETHTPFDHGGVNPDRRRGTVFPAWSDVAELTSEQQDHAAGYQGAAASLDGGVARILEGLRESGLDENAIVLFTSDHGPEFPLGKWSLYDGGLRVAALLRWPAGGWHDGRVIAPMVANVDLMPTLMTAAGLPVPENLDGHDLGPLLRGETDAGRDAVFGLFVGQRYAVRTARFLLICNTLGSLHTPAPGEAGSGNPALELYDLESDPLARRNLAYEPDWLTTRRQMSHRLVQWLREVNDPVLQGQVQGPIQPVKPPDDRWHEGVGQLLDDANMLGQPA